tara:strand:- start:2144 stop:2365 length:222 start_codon:yes stop_codon:yes gene_type:complete
MGKVKNKKPTMNDVRGAINTILVDMSYLSQHVARIDAALAGYINFRKDSKKYNKWLEKQAKEKSNAREEKNTK